MTQEEKLKILYDLSVPSTTFSTPCVYILWQKNRIFYVGASSSIGKRLREHKSRGLVFDRITVLTVDDEEQKQRIERWLIHELDPPYNITHKRPAEREVARSLRSRSLRRGGIT